MINGTMSPSNKSSVSTSSSASAGSRNDKVCFLKNPINEKIKYSYFS